MAKFSAKIKVQKQLEAFHEQLSRETAPFSDTSRAAIRERWDRCAEDTSAFIDTYTPHYKDAPDAAFHPDLDAMINYPEHGLFWLHGPREHAKSVRCRLNILRRMLGCELKYYLFASEKVGQSWSHIEYIHFELTENHRISSDFVVEELKRDSQAGIYRVRITNRATGRSTMCQLQAVSSDTSAKGLTYMQYRPQGALVDDLEKTKDTYKRENGRKKLDFVKQELWPACTGTVVWLGNMGRKDSALHQAFEEEYEDQVLDALKQHGTDPGAFARECAENGGRMAGEEELAHIKGFIYRATTVMEDGSVRYLWKERFSPGWYAAKKRIMGWRFEGEENGNPVNPGTIFSNFPTYSQIPEEAVWFTWFDPAWGRSKTSSHKCWGVGAYDGHYFYIVDAYCRVGTPMSEPIDHWYDAFDRFASDGLLDGGFEDAYDQDQRMSQDLALAEERHNTHLPVWPMKNPGQKDVRILSIEQLVELGRVLWPEKLNDDLQELKNQMEIYDPLLSTIPKDGPDMLAKLITELRKRWRNANSSGYTSLGKRRYNRSRRR